MLVFAASRWPGMLPQNFSAAHALLFCAAFWLPGWMGWVLPLATIIVTDILLNLFHYSMPVMVPELVVNWMILALFVVLAKWLARRRSYGRVFLGTLIGALLFYLVSNTVSWLVNPVYAKSIAGWVQALTVGLPGFPPTWLPTTLENYDFLEKISHFDRERIPERVVHARGAGAHGYFLFSA